MQPNLNIRDFIRDRVAIAHKIAADHRENFRFQALLWAQVNRTLTLILYRTRYLPGSIAQVVPVGLLLKT